MILAFKTKFDDGTPTNFVEKILSGKKIHTIRGDVNSRWGKGRMINYATGIRTPDYKEFKKGECVSIQRIEFIWNCINTVTDSWDYKILIDKRQIPQSQIEELAKNDGFDSLGDFLNWEGWNKKYFKGVIIHFTDKQYY